MCCAALKNVNPSPPNPYISEMAFSCRFQKVYTYPPPPPQVTTCLHTEAKVVESAEMCQNPESWQVLNVPGRYGLHLRLVWILLTASAQIFAPVRKPCIGVLGDDPWKLQGRYLHNFCTCLPQRLFEAHQCPGLQGFRDPKRAATGASYIGQGVGEG